MDFVIESGVLKKYNGNENEVIIPDNVVEISEGCFENSTITKVVFPDTLEKIGIGAFLKCKRLRELIIPNSVKEIEYKAFADCCSIETIKLSESLSCISCAAFYGCSSLKSITIPKGIKSIEKNAFFACNDLKTIIFPDSEIEFGPKAFARNGVLTWDYATFIVAKNYYKKFNHNEDDIFFNRKTLFFHSTDEFSLAKKEDKVLFINTDSKVLNGDIFHDLIYEIEEEMNSNIDEEDDNYIEFDIDSVRILDFSKAQSIEILDNEYNDSMYDGYHFSELYKIMNWPNNLIEIGKDYFRETRIVEIEFPPHLEKIDERAFYYCKKLEKIILPETIKVIDPSAFHGCYNLNEIHFKGTMEQWKKVEIKEWEKIFTDEISCTIDVICSDGVGKFDLHY